MEKEYEVHSLEELEALADSGEDVHYLWCVINMWSIQNKRVWRALEKMSNLTKLTLGVGYFNFPDLLAACPKLENFTMVRLRNYSDYSDDTIDCSGLQSLTIVGDVPYMSTQVTIENINGPRYELAKIDHDWSKMKHLDIRYTQTLKGVNFIPDWSKMDHVENIHALRLECVEFTDDTFCEFIKLVNKCRENLTELEIVQCNIYAKGAKLLAELIGNLPHLSVFDVSLNPIGIDGVKAIASAVAVHPSIREWKIISVNDSYEYYTQIHTRNGVSAVKGINFNVTIVCKIGLVVLETVQANPRLRVVEFSDATRYDTFRTVSNILKTRV